MLTGRHLASAAALLFFSLPGCVDDTGTYCRYDYQCVSNSCTWSSCDDPLITAIFRAGTKADEDREEPSTPAPKPAPEPRRDCPWLCEVLSSEYQCNQATGCHVEWECAKPQGCADFACVTASCGALNADTCQAPCVRQVRCVGKREC